MRKLPKSISKLRRKYTKSVKHDNHLYVALLKIGCQSFVIAPACSSELTMYFRTQIATALDNFLKIESEVKG